jgi:ABC-type glycerol-3-phosphate transport system substrate-binding protein
MVKGPMVAASAVLCAAAVLAGCSKTPAAETKAPVAENKAPTAESKAEPVKAISNEPVTLKATANGISVDDVYLEAIKEQLKKKHPNITLEYTKPGKGQELPDLVAAGSIPDLVFTHTGALVPMKPLDVLFDLNPLVKQYSVDLNRFEKAYMDDIKGTADKGELYAFPLYSKYHANYYNKDLFDKFGVPYPKDGMTIDQTVELAKRVSRIEGGVTYRGLNTGSNIIWIAQPMSLFTVNADKPTVSTDGWRKMFELGKAIYSIPGNEWTSRSPRDQFLKDRTLSMFLFQNLLDELGAASKDGMNWDLVQYPSFPENPNVFPSASTDVIMVTKTSKYKEQALQVMNVLTSDELQMIRSKQGTVTSLKNPDIKAAFGSELKFAEGKNLKGIFKSRPALTPPISPYRQQAESIVRRKFEDYLNNVSDANTILRMADEEIAKLIADDKKK